MVRNSLLILFLFAGFIVQAHGDLHERILKVTEEIKTKPDSAFLYFKRGKLYYQHKDFKSSLKDFNRSEELGYKNNEQYLLFAKNYFQLKKYNLSLKHAQKILNNQPNNVNAIKLIGDINFSKKKYKKSAKAFEKVLQYSEETFPENYLDASLAWYSLKTSKGTKYAISVLNDGIEKFGNNIVLYLKLISISIDQQDYTSAIKYQKKVIDFSLRKERAYLKLANLQILQNNYTDASVSIENAQKYYKSLPDRIKVTKFMREFFSELELKDQLLKKEKLQGI